MAELKCPECGNMISENAEYCVHCGNPINKMPKKKKRKIAWIVGIIAAVLLAGLVLCWFFLLPEMRYGKALASYQNEEFEEAERILSENPRHKKSQELLDACIYNQALLQFNEKKYLECFQRLKGCDGLQQAEELKQTAAYYLAEEALEAQEYDQAIEYLKENPYSGSQELLEKVKIEKERHEKADAAFLQDLASSVEWRMSNSLTARLDLVNTELAYVEKYKNAEFYDKELGQLATTYIEALYLQKESINIQNESESQEKWITGLVSRCEVLNKLYEEYDFLSENKEFVGIYVYHLEGLQKELKALKEIKEDIDRQCENNENITTNGYYLIMRLTNNTQYTYSVHAHFRFFTVDKQTLYENNYQELDGIQPGEKYVLEVYIGLVNGNTWDYSYDIWIEDIICK